MNPLLTISIGAIRLYQWTLSPLKSAVLGPSARCRFTPSCSAYALEALRQHGLLHGAWLSLRRIVRCHPWGGCGNDPVPPRRNGNPPARHRSSLDRSAAPAGNLVHQPPLIR